MKTEVLPLVLAAALMSGCSIFATPESVEQRTSEIAVERISVDANSQPLAADGRSSLRVISLNMAHGRKDSFSQFFVGEDEIRANLADIARFLERENADIVTLQEADSPSRWSGNFDHVEWLAREAGYPWYTHGNHVDNVFGTYGTAVLSRLPIRRGLRVDFEPTPPTTRKGFTLAEIEWAPAARGERQVVDVVSVHLDFSRRSKRIEQTKDIKAVLGERNNPAIVLGDFNSSWEEGEQELQSLARVQKLKTHRPEANHLYTYFDERFDWILVSEDFEFCQYYAATDILSDHLAVVSEIVAKDENNQPAECNAS